MYLSAFPPPRQMARIMDCWGRGLVGMDKEELGEERLSPWGARGDRVGGRHAGFAGGQREILQANSRFFLWRLGQQCSALRAAGSRSTRLSWEAVTYPALGPCEVCPIMGRFHLPKSYPLHCNLVEKYWGTEGRRKKLN